MKKLLLPVLIIGSLQLAAQQLSHELSLSYAFRTIEHSGRSFSDTYSSLIVMSSPYQVDQTFAMSPYIAYRKDLGSRLSAGVSVGYEQYKGDYYGWAGGNKLGSFVKQSVVVAGELRCGYVSHGKYHLYGLAGAGFAAVSLRENTAFTTDHTKTSRHFTYHVAPLGLAYGHKLRPFAELGYGYKGIVNAGLRVKM